MIPKEQAHLAVAAITHPGMSGKNNEDRYAVHAYALSESDPTPALFAIVADGIGGHLAGEVAAEIVVETISAAIAASDARDPINTLKQAIIDAGQAVHAQAEAHQAQSGMGSTCACVWIIGNQLYTASVGDSRIYLLRDNTIQQLTVDHTWVQEAIEHGIITREQARSHPQAHIIRRYLGSKQPTEADFRLKMQEGESNAAALANQGMPLLPHDRLVLCSDGLTDLVDDNEILSTLQLYDLQTGVGKLVDLANARGGHDNITIVALHMPGPTVSIEQPRRKRGWLIALVALFALVIVLAGLALFAWGLRQPPPTATAAPPTPLPVIVETSAPAASLTPSPTLPPPPTFTPGGATYTPWPTSTP